MKSAATLPEAARDEVRRIVVITRLAGVAVAAALAVSALYINRATPLSLEAITNYFSIVVGLGAFVALSTLARMGHARVLERALVEVNRLTEQLRDLADHDPLTGLYNLRSFQQIMETEMEQARRDGRAVSLIVADLDNFKLLNDSFGHQFGDAVLRETGQVFTEWGGLRGLAARLGGDEFALLIPGATRDAALRAAHDLEAALRAVRFNGQGTAMLGSFGIGTCPADGNTVQALFAAADGRMYSEKHRRKAESLSSLAGAARKLFVRAGRAMRPDQTAAQILQEIAQATHEEFALSLCAISIHPRAHHPRVMAVAATSPELEMACVESGARGAFDVNAISPLVPAEMWLIEASIPDESGDGGLLLLGGLPTTSFRPDAPVVVALADLLHAVVANDRARVDATQAGRERDIHIDLAHALAGGGALAERLSAVTALISDFIGASTVSIEGLRPVADAIPYSLATQTGAQTVGEWVASRATDEARQFMAIVASEAPCIIDDPQHDERVPAAQRDVLARARVETCAFVPIRFDGQSLGLVGAASDEPGFFNEDKLAVLLTIADHLAPAISVALLRDELEASYTQLERESRESLARLADAAEARDPHTGGHLRRIRYYCVELARQLGLPDEEAQAIGAASAIHDLGKLSLPDSVLMKPGKLTPEDWDRMREHPRHGEQLIGDSPKFELERVVARWHHERWDGTGYPDGLRREQIPLAARIVAVADALDALTTERPYKHAWSLDDAFMEVRRASGKLFCPRVVGALDVLWRSGRLARLYEAAGDAEQAFLMHAREAA